MIVYWTLNQLQKNIKYHIFRSKIAININMVRILFYFFYFFCLFLFLISRSFSYTRIKFDQYTGKFDTITIWYFFTSTFFTQYIIRYFQYDINIKSTYKENVNMNINKIRNLYYKLTCISYFLLNVDFSHILSLFELCFSTCTRKHIPINIVIFHFQVLGLKSNSYWNRVYMFDQFDVTWLCFLRD